MKKLKYMALCALALSWIEIFSATTITNANFKTEFKNYKKTEFKNYKGPLVIFFYAPWSGPDQAMLPIFEELEKEFSKKYKFAKVNIDEANDIGIKFNIEVVPTFIFLKRGQILGKEIGLMSKENFKTKLQSYLEH